VLLDRAAGLALLPAKAQRAALCRLALAGRPGTARGFIDRHRRDELREATGSAAFDALAAAGEMYRIDCEAAAEWSLVDWIHAGRCAWQRLLPPGCAALQRWVELTLPPTGIGAQPGGAPELSAPRALALLDTLDMGWPC
jgi:hypothetical protein